MAELSTLDVEKLIHLFVQNLTFQVSSNCNKKLDRVNFISCIDVAYHTNNAYLKESYFTDFEHIRQKTLLNEEYLQLYINNVEFMKNVHVTLHVASKVI